MFLLKIHLLFLWQIFAGPANGHGLDVTYANGSSYTSHAFTFTHHFESEKVEPKYIKKKRRPWGTQLPMMQISCEITTVVCYSAPHIAGDNQPFVAYLNPDNRERGPPGLI